MLPLASARAEAALAGITVHPGTLYPAFAPDIDTYEVELPLGAAGFSLSVAPRSQHAQVHIDGVAMRLTSVPRDTTTRIEVTDPSGETALVIVRSRPPKQTAYIKASNPDVGDGFGVAVAISRDGAVLAIGAPGEDSRALGTAGHQQNNGRVDSGAVYLYRRGTDTWRFDGYVKSRLPTHGFGAAVALSDDGGTLAVGEPDEDTGAIGSGAVEVYAREKLGWRYAALVKPREPLRGGSFGASVALAGDVLAVGAPGEDAAYVWRNGYRESERVAVAPAGERFGETVSLGADGSVLAVSGSAVTRVYSATKAGLREVLTLPGQRGAVSGDGHVVAALEPARGCVRVYRDGAKGWVAAARFAGEGERVALDFDGDALVVGHVVDRAGFRGGARVFRWDGVTWRPGQALLAENANANDLVGSSVTIDGAGATVALGAPGEDGIGPELSGDPSRDDLESSGAAYVFR